MMNTKEFWDKVDKAIEAVESQGGVAYDHNRGHCMYLLGNTSCIAGHFFKDRPEIWKKLKNYRGDITDFVYEFELTPKLMGVDEKQQRILNILQNTHDSIVERIIETERENFEFKENPWSRLREKAKELKE